MPAGRQDQARRFASPKASCLAGIGAGITAFVEAANAVLTKMGLKKGETSLSTDLTNRLCQDLIGATT